MTMVAEVLLSVMNGKTTKSSENGLWQTDMPPMHHVANVQLTELMSMVTTVLKTADG